MDDLLSQLESQFQEDIKNDEPIKEELHNEDVAKERFKVSDEYIEKRREMVELSKIEEEDNSSFFKTSKKSKKESKEEDKDIKKSSSGSTSYYGRTHGYGYGYGSTSTKTEKKESTINQEKATEYADNIFDNLRDKLDDEFDGSIPDDWDIFDIHETANIKHKIAKETKKNGKLPLKVKMKLAALKGCVYLGHSTLETLYILKNE